MRSQYPQSHSISVVVASGTGTGTLNFTNNAGYRISTVTIDAPQDTTAYSYTLRDANAVLVGGAADLVGDNVFEMEKALRGTATITITGDNGTYAVTIWLVVL